MTPQSADYFDVDKASAEPDSAQRVARYFGLTEDELHLTGQELRTRCFLQCGRNCPTGDRVLAIQTTHAAKIWKCHNYGCTKQGNLVSLVSLAMGLSDRPRKEEFKLVRDKLREILSADGASAAPTPTATMSQTRPTGKSEQPPQFNPPLAQHPNERARTVADLYRKLTMDVSTMPPHAAQYVRMRPFLTPEVAAEWKLGYLPRDTGGDTSGGTMRGKFVVAIENSNGEIVGYAGRDTDWESKHQAWIAGNREGKEPAKWTFPSNFHRGIEVYNQHRLMPELVGERLQRTGLPVVEGVNDAINLQVTLDLPAVAILSNHATDEQIARIAEIAYSVADGTVTLLYDCDDEGNRGMDQDTVKFAKVCRVQRGWAMDMHEGRFAGMQPENLTRHNGAALVRIDLAVKDGAEASR